MTLTPRESSVLKQLLTGKTVKECAKELGIGRGTFKIYASRVYCKMGVHTRVGLMALGGVTFGKMRFGYKAREGVETPTS